MEEISKENKKQNLKKKPLIAFTGFKGGFGKSKIAKHIFIKGN